jgi:hypothetical protein
MKILNAMATHNNDGYYTYWIFLGFSQMGLGSLKGF